MTFFSFQCLIRAERLSYEALYIVCHPSLLPCANLLLYISDICCDFQSVFLMTY